MVETRSIIKKLSRFFLALTLLLVFTGPSHGGRRTAEMTVQARVLPRLSFRILDQPATLRISKRDLKKEMPRERGRIKGRVLISVDTNNPVGFILQVQAFDNRLFSSIKITLKESGQVFHLSPGRQIEIHIPNREKDRDVNKLDFDFNLLSGVEAGRYPWPIAVTARLL